MRPLIVCWAFTPNKQQDATQALAYLQRAVALEPENARFLFELDFCKNYWPGRYMSD